MSALGAEAVLVGGPVDGVDHAIGPRVRVGARHHLGLQILVARVTDEALGVGADAVAGLVAAGVDKC